MGQDLARYDSIGSSDHIVRSRPRNVLAHYHPSVDVMAAYAVSLQSGATRHLSALWLRPPGHSGAVSRVWYRNRNNSPVASERWLRLRWAQTGCVGVSLDTGCWDWRAMCYEMGAGTEQRVPILARFWFRQLASRSDGRNLDPCIMPGRIVSRTRKNSGVNYLSAPTSVRVFAEFWV